LQRERRDVFCDGGRESPILLTYGVYSIEKITSVLNPVLEKSGLFLVDLSVGSNNHIKVLIDSEKGISVDECVRVSRYLEAELDRDEEDFELEVSSPGVGTPLKVFQQYIQNIGRTVAVVTKDNGNYTGELLEVDDQSILLKAEKYVRQGKRKVKQLEEKRIPFEEIKSTKVIIKF
jgi:ribosome maturation factor RimP